VSGKHAFNLSLPMVIVQNPNEAIEKGYDYNTWSPVPIGLKVEKVVVVHNGMQSGASTVDIIFVDDKGNKYVTLISGNLLKMVASAI
jgi:hypothetical protein